MNNLKINIYVIKEKKYIKLIKIIITRDVWVQPKVQ